MTSRYSLYFTLILVSIYDNFAFKTDRERSSVVNSSLTSEQEWDGLNWMSKNMKLLGQRTLKEICIPGSHDAGMSEYHQGTLLAHPCNVLTQSNPVSGQLKLGVRYFDVRPVIGNGGRFLTGHYTSIGGLTWQGGNGQTIESIVSDFNEFTRTHNEVVIVRLAHSLNTEVGNSKYRKFNQTEWDRLFQILDRTNNLYNNNDKNVSLPLLTLNQLTENGKKSAILYIVSDPESGVNLGSRLGKGYFDHSNINMYHKYSKTDNLTHMVKDQLKKLKEFSKNKYFLLSWTLTLNGKDAAMCQLKFAKSIRHLADYANAHLTKSIYKEISSSFYPNVLYVDNINNMEIVKLAMSINSKLNFP